MSSAARTTIVASMLAVALSAVSWLVAVPANAAWKAVLSYEGGVTQLCMTRVGAKQVRVKVRMNNTRGRQVAKAGINRLVGGRPGNAWTYTSSTPQGEVSDVRSLRFAKGAKVHAIVGSAVGITDTRDIRISNIPRC